MEIMLREVVMANLLQCNMISNIYFQSFLQLAN
jgi:hypothetical protein